MAQENLLLSWKEILQLLQHLPEGGAARRAVTSVSDVCVCVCVCVGGGGGGGGGGAHVWMYPVCG